MSAVGSVVDDGVSGDAKRGGRKEVGEGGRWTGGVEVCDGLERDASRKLVVDWLSFVCWYANPKLERWRKWSMMGGRTKMSRDRLGRPSQAARSIRLRKFQCRHRNFYHLVPTPRQVGRPRNQGRSLAM